MANSLNNTIPFESSTTHYVLVSSPFSYGMEDLEMADPKKTILLLALKHLNRISQNLKRRIVDLGMVIVG